MDSYSKDLHLKDKDYVPDMRDNELCSLEDREESQPRFSVDEVQLRFDLGSLVDAQVLLDAHEQRENHWDFMRQDQGRFPTSSEENTSLKQDTLKSFANCDGWPRSTSRVDSQLFIHAQDDVSMITEVFGGRDKSIGSLAEDDGGLLVHREEASAWIGKSGKGLAGEAQGQGIDNSCKEDSANEAMEVSQVSIERPDSDLSPPQISTFQPKINNENQETEDSLPGLVIEPLLNNEQRIVDNSFTEPLREAECCGLPNMSQEVQDKKQAELGKPVEMPEQAETQLNLVNENANEQVGLKMGAQGLHGSEEESKVIAVETREAEIPTTKLGVELLSQWPGLMEKDGEAGQLLSNITQEITQTATKPVILSHVMPRCACPSSEQEMLDVTPDVMAKQSAPSVDRAEVTNLPETDNKQDTSGLPCADETVIGTAVQKCKVEEIDQGQGTTEEGLDEQGQATLRATDVEQVNLNGANEKELATMELLTSEELLSCPKPSVTKQDPFYVCMGAGNTQSTSLCHGMKQEDAIHNLSAATVDPALKDAINQACIEDISELPAGDDVISDSNIEPVDHDGKDIPNLVQKDVISVVLATKDSFVGSTKLNTQMETKDGAESSRQDTVPDDIEASVKEPLEMKHGDHDTSHHSSFSSKFKPLIQDDIAMDVSQLGGGLHVVLNVQQEGALGDFISENFSQPKMIEGKGLTDGQTINTADAISGAMKRDSGEIVGGSSCTNVYGLTALAAISGSQELASTVMPNVTTPEDKVSKRKSDASSRSNRLKDSARASPFQESTDQEPKSGGKEGSRRRKMTPKAAAQQKGGNMLEGYSSPNKMGSKSALGLKKKKSTSLCVPQDAVVSTVAPDGSQQSPLNTSKTVSSMDARQHILPDFNVSEMAVPKVLPVQPFKEPQQVQLRAQILVYGSLIQGAAPEEALMVAAFSNVTGERETGRATEASERAVWEKQWQVAVERVHAKSSMLRDPMCANRGLVSNLPTTEAPKAITTNAAGLHARVFEIPNTKSHFSRPNQGGDLGADHLLRSDQVAFAPAPAPASSTATALHPVTENSTHFSKPCIDIPQTAPQAFYPSPPLGTFMTGTPQWLSPPLFAGSWIPQTKAAVYNTPSASFTHGKGVISLDQTQEKAAARRNSPSLFGQVVSGSPMVPASVMPTTAPDPMQIRQPASESRPRKRKKTQCGTYVPPAETNLCTGNQTASISTLSITSSGQAGLTISSPTKLPLAMTPESLAIVVTNTETSKMTRVVPSRAVEASAPTSANMLNPYTPILATAQQLERAKTSSSQLEQAQASAEEAASVAASAMRESEGLWNQLKAQKSSGLTLAIEMQLVSSAVAMATAASVAKAAAAAARAAYEAAIQANKLSEEAIGSRKQPESSRLLQDKAKSNALQSWQMPESCNSFMAASKMSSKKRLEAASAACARAQNYDSIVRAAELTSNAVTQIGSVMAMGNSLPFTLEMLMDAGPEGLHRVLSTGLLEDKQKAKGKGTGGQTPGKKGAPKQKVLEEKDKRSSNKIFSGSKECSLHKEAQAIHWTLDMDNVKGFNGDYDFGLMRELSNQKYSDLSPVYTQTSRLGIIPSIRPENGLTTKDEFLSSDSQILKDSLVEVMSNEKGLRGVWFSARVQNVESGKVLVLYDDLLSDDGFSPLEEWINLKSSPSKAPRVRLAHPNTNIGFDGTRKRRREAMGSHKWAVGDRVDAWMRDGWWEGEIKEIIEDGGSNAKVFFPGDGDTSFVKTSKLRPSLVWNNGLWVLSSDAKQRKIELSKVLHEGATPVAKRQKTDKVKASAGSREKLMGTSLIHMAPTGSLFDTAATKLAKDAKGSAVDGEDKPKQQGSKVVFGVPRPTKKRRLIEVSKHSNSAWGARSTNTLATSKRSVKVNTTGGFVPGSAEASKLNGAKMKKKVLSRQKARPAKRAEVETGQVKGSTIRNKKERPLSDTKISVQKDASTKEALLLVSKDNELIKKKATSDGSQPSSQGQEGGFPACMFKVTALANAAILQELNGSASRPEESEAQNAGQGSENQDAHPVKETNQGAHPIKETVREPTKKASGDKQPPSHLSKDSKNQPAQQAKESEHCSHSLKEKETLGMDKEKSGHLLKETQTQTADVVKESESQAAHESDEQLAGLGNSKGTKAGEIQPSLPGKDARKAGAETWEPRRTSRKIQPTSKLLEALQTASKHGKNSSSYDKGSRLALKAPTQP